jgi:hypothetical protein
MKWKEKKGNNGRRKNLHHTSIYTNSVNGVSRGEHLSFANRVPIFVRCRLLQLLLPHCILHKHEHNDTLTVGQLGRVDNSTLYLLVTLFPEPSEALSHQRSQRQAIQSQSSQNEVAFLMSSGNSKKRHFPILLLTPRCIHTSAASDSWCGEEGGWPSGSGQI